MNSETFPTIEAMALSILAYDYGRFFDGLPADDEELLEHLADYCDWSKLGNECANADGTYTLNYSALNDSTEEFSLCRDEHLLNSIGTAVARSRFYRTTHPGTVDLDTI